MPLHPRRRPETHHHDHDHHEEPETLTFSNSSSSDEPEHGQHGPLEVEPEEDRGEEAKRDFQPPPPSSSSASAHGLTASTPSSSSSQWRHRRREIAPRGTSGGGSGSGHSLPTQRRRTTSSTAADDDHDEDEDHPHRASYGGGETTDWPPLDRQPQEFMYFSSPPPYPPSHMQPTTSSHIMRSRNTNTHNRMSGGPPTREFHPDVSFGPDLDYLPPVNDDEIGPDVAETFNLGSFGEDSPPRGTPHRRSSPRSSPPPPPPSRYPYPYPPPQHAQQHGHPQQHQQQLAPYHQPHPGYSPYTSGVPPPPPQQQQQHPRQAPYAATATPSSYPSYYPPPPSQPSPYGPSDPPPPQYGAAQYPPYYYYPPPSQHYPTQQQQQHQQPPRDMAWSSPEAYHGPPPPPPPPPPPAQPQPSHTSSSGAAPARPTLEDLDRKYPATTTTISTNILSSPSQKKKKKRSRSLTPRREMAVATSTTPPKDRDDDDDDDDESLKMMEEDEQGRLMLRSPFRSPAPSSASKFKKFFHPSPPGIGTMGSFGLMGTPGGLGGSEFSPMEGQHTPFGTSHSLDDPLPLGADDFGTRLPLADEEDEPRRPQASPPQEQMQKPALQPQPTPMLSQRRLSAGGSGSSSGFGGDFSPLGGGMQVSRSPLRSERRSRESSEAYSSSGILSPPRASSRSPLPGGPPLSSSSTTRRIAPPRGEEHPRSSAKPRKLWHDTGAPTPGPVRLELGDVGGLSQRQRTLEGINSMMRASSSKPPPKTPGPSSADGRPPFSVSRTPAPSGRVQMPPSTYRDPSGTPSHRPPSRGTPGAHVSYSRHQPHSFPQPPPSSVAKASPGSMYTSLAVRSTPSTAHGMGKAHHASSGKENTGNGTPSTASKRKPCNCKKSKCLKLYCECFAAELYCEGCNCSECNNLAAFEPGRSKAIKDIRSKNPNAFKPRIALKQTPVEGPAPQSHNMGCRCKRSECLKKYCECFQAGIICGNKCKCVECMNFAGSQALIDKRRKIKDHRGADFAMRVADEAWKGKSSTPRNPSLPAIRGVGGGLTPSPSGRGQFQPQMQPSMMQRSSPTGSHVQHSQGQQQPHQYMPHHMMAGAPHSMGYSQMGMPAVTPGFQGNMPPPFPQQHLSQESYRVPGQESHRMPTPSRYAPPRYEPPPVASAPRSTTKTSKATSLKKPPLVTPSAAVTPRTPAIRLGFDASKRRSKITLPEPTLDYFGPSRPEQPKTTALSIFSYLSNDDLYNAGLVCKRWSRLAMDEELWQFQA